MANWEKSLGLTGIAIALLIAGCGTGSPARPGTSPGRASTAATARAAQAARPEQWRLVRASRDLRDITLAVPACERIARVAVRESAARALITVYAETGTACGWQHMTQRTVFLAKPIGCERRLYDGAVNRPPQFATDADTASVTFSCPASA